MSTQSWKQLMDQAQAGFEALPPGPYDAEIIKAEYKTASTGKPMWVVQFKVLAGPYANKVVFNQFVLSEDNPNALGMFFRHMAVLGLDGEFFGMLPEGQAGYDAIAGALVGKKAKITLSQREYPKGSGTMRNQVDDVQASQLGANEPVRQIAQAGVPTAAPTPAPAPAPAPAPQAAPAQAPAPAPQPAAAPAPAQPQAAPVAPQAAPAPAPAPAQPEAQPAPQAAPEAAPAQPAPEPQPAAEPQPAEQAQSEQPAQPAATPSAPPF